MILSFNSNKFVVKSFKSDKFCSMTSKLKLLILLSIILHINNILAQSPTLVCQGNVNLSLDDDCQVPLTTALTLVGNPVGNYTFYIKNGTISLGNIANATMVGKQLQFVVSDNSGNSCWGNLLVEDKLAPVINCPIAPIVLKCEAFNTLNISTSEKEWKTALPTGLSITENCGDLKILYADIVENLPCNNPISTIIRRTFRAIDKVGNSATCTIIYHLERRTLAEITMPGDYAIECSNANVRNNTVIPSISGSPTINGTSVFPSTSLFCDLSSIYTDAITNGCGKTFKIVRTWIVTDCAGNVRISTQIINVRDSQAPIFSACPTALLQVSATGDNCDLDNFNLPFPSFSDNCDENPSKSIVIKKGNSIIAGGFPISNLGLGNYTIEFQATDVCGNVGVCTQMLQIIDNVPPIAVCDQNTKVSLTLDGTATMNATTLDDGSKDNCCFNPNSFVVKRSNEPDAAYFPSIKFSCKDTLVMVTLRVSDCQGNYNTCMVNVRVEDKLVPQIAAKDTSVLCSSNAIAKQWLDKNRPTKASLLRLPSMGFAGWYDNALDCGVSIDSVDAPNIDNCGKGTYSRTWTIKDSKGQSASTIQKYNSEAIFDYSVKFPADVLLNTGANCAAQLTSPDFVGVPIITQQNGTCANVAFRYSDEIFDASGNNVCFAIKRKWQVQNLCEPMSAFTQVLRNLDGSAVTINYNSTNRGAFEYIQIIKIQDQNAPVWTQIPDPKVEPIGKECKSKIIITKPSALDCTTNLIYYYEIYKPNGTLIQNSASFPAEITVNAAEFGDYKVIYRVTDRCGNSNATTKLVQVKDILKPTPLCHQKIAVSLGQGQVMVQATVFDAGSYDNCTPSNKLKFRIRVIPDGNIFVNPDTLPTMYTFTCIDKFIPFGGFLGYTKGIQLWVGDEAGNWDFCETSIEVQDNMQICQYEANEMRMISGAIETENGKAIENVNIELKGLYDKDMSTPNSGKFAFADLPVTGFYTLKPEKNNQNINGVTTYDLVMISKHILGITPLKTPYQWIAADVNQSGTIATSDIVELRKMILGLQNSFSKNKSWRFIDKNYQFSTLTNALNQAFPEEVELKGLNLTNANKADFIGVKIGDVNASALTSTARSSSVANIKIKDYHFKKEEQFSVKFTPDFNISAYQFTLEFENLELVEIKGNKDNFALLENNILTISSIENTTFELIFKAKTNGILSEHLLLTSNRTTALAYNENAEEFNLRLEIDGKNPKFELFQNQPNPFNQQTTITFSLPERTEVNFSIWDINGKVIANSIISGERGFNEFSIDKTILPTAGIYYYQLSTLTHQATRKMIITE